MSADSHKSQQAAILALLVCARGAEVGLPEILRLGIARIARYNARVDQLRKLGFRITNRTQVVEGKRHSWFRLEPGPMPVQNELTLTGVENPRYGD